ncbi:hypothetical protein AAC387_Pa12g0602 [Persea americana]
MHAFLSTPAKRLQVPMDTELRSGLAATQALSFFTTAAVDSNPWRSAVLIPRGLGPCSDLSTHQRGRRPTEAYLLYEQDPARCRNSILTARKACPRARQRLAKALPLLLNLHNRGRD